MLNNSHTPLLERKEAIIMACIEALAPVNTIDVCSDEAKQALREAYQMLASYPGLVGYKRLIVKEDTPDKYVFRAFYILKGVLLIGETNSDALDLINESLAYALEDLQVEIDILTA